MLFVVHWLPFFVGFQNPVVGSVEVEFNNTRMLKVRECVEWGVKEITTQFKYLDFKILNQI